MSFGINGKIQTGNDGDGGGDGGGDAHSNITT